MAEATVESPNLFTDQLDEIGLVVNESAEHKASDCEADEDDAIEPSTELKLKCFIYVLVLIAVGFITTVVETQAFFKKKGKKILQRLTVEWICYGIKCGFILPAIGALLFLQYGAMQTGKISKVRLQLKSHASVSTLTLKNADRLVVLPRSLSNTPSKPFIFMSLLFAFFACLSFVIEIACGVIAASQSADALTRLTEMSEVIRRFLLSVFFVLQTYFFLIHNRVCIQWKMKKVWLAASHILASNIAFWFINVGFELCEVIDTSENDVSVNSYCTNTTIDSIARTLYPFLIEYYVMNALLAYAFLSNTGRLVAAIRKGATVSTELIRGLINPELQHRHGGGRVIQTEYFVMKTYSGTIGVGVGLMLISLAVSVFIRFVGNVQMTIQIVFYCTQVLLYTSGIVCSAKLLRALKKETPGQKLSKTHRTDRILLWIGTAAITINDSYTIWNSCTNIATNISDPESVTNFTMMALCAILNISQSLIQVYALECALVRKFRADVRSGVSYVLYGRALLTFLILLNASEWLINTICFSFFFPPREMEDALALSLLAMPLQVFYRFHSIACIQDFKSHCGDEHQAAHHPDELAHPLVDIEVEFPDMNQLNDSLLSDVNG